MSRGGSFSSNGFGQQQRTDYGSMSSTAGGAGGGGGENFGGFSPTEFISLSENIAINIRSIKSSWNQLEKAIKIIGSARDNQTARDKVHHIQTTTNGKITATSKDLQRLTALVRGGDRQQKLQVERLTSEFKEIVEKYHRSQQTIAGKMKQILLINASQQDDWAAATQTMAEGSDRDELVRRQAQQNIEFEQGMLLDREQRVRQIENDVLDINQIMKDLATLVNIQGESIDTIESTIERTAGDVESGQTELQKAAAYQAKYRRKVLILLLIAVIVGLIVTGIIVSQLKS